jgi:hypothetical protein
MPAARRTEPVPVAHRAGRRSVGRAAPLALLAVAWLSWPAPTGAQNTGVPGTDAVQTETLEPLLPLPPAQPPAAPPAQAPAQVPAAAPAEPTTQLPAQPPAAVPDDETMRVILQGLDKTTARVSTVEAPVGGMARFGTLEIVARACHKKPPTEPPESAAFLEITDVRPDSPAVSIFSGWMFASSPALSALEHPVYDVWVIDCRKGPPAKTAGQPDDAAPETVPAPEVPGEIPEDSEAAPAD